MEVWGPKLPPGWRYPVGEHAVRQSLAGIPELRIRFAFGPSSRADAIVANASFWQAAPSIARVPYLTIYGQSDDGYPEAASLDFAASVLPQVNRYFLDRLALQGPAADFDLKSLNFTWDGKRHICQQVRAT